MPKILRFTTLIIFLIHLLSPTLSSPQTESRELKVKKIVMMMNIVTKEYGLGIKNGKVINALEYEESQVFLEQARERYRSLLNGSADGASKDPLLPLFSRLLEKLSSKVDPGEVTVMVNQLNASLLNIFQIEISKAPISPVSLANGKKIYTSNCALCHGYTGKGDGPLSSQLDPLPAVLADPEITGDGQTVAYDNFQVINVGIANTAMMSWTGMLSESDIWDVTYYIRTFSNDHVKLPLLAAGLADGSPDEGGQHAEKVITETRALLQKSLEIFKENKIDEAAETAFDAYMNYENIESGLIGKRKILGLRLESAFSRYRAEIKRQAPLSHVENILADIERDLERALEILREKVGFTGLFIQSLSIIVREGFEAILIIAALITFLIKSRNQDKLPSIYIGVAIGIAGSFLTAYILHEVLNVSMASQEILEGWIMLVAVVVLFWVSYWLVSKIEAAKWQSYITSKVQTAVSQGSAFTLGAVAFLSVYREGFETVLFYKALYLYAGVATDGIVPGFLAGCLILAVVYYLISKLGIRVPIKWFFGVTSVFLYFMAFVFMGKGLHELQMGKFLSMTSIDFIPQVSWLGMYPTQETLIGQGVLLLAFIFALIYTFVIKPEVDSKELQSEANHIQADISMVHDLVEHISHHAKRCEIFLKDTKDQDLKELSEHLKEIDAKVHELFDHVQYMGNQLQDEYERIAQPAFEAENRKKGLP